LRFVCAELTITILGLLQLLGLLDDFLDRGGWLHLRALGLLGLLARSWLVLVSRLLGVLCPWFEVFLLLLLLLPSCGAPGGFFRGLRVGFFSHSGVVPLELGDGKDIQGLHARVLLFGWDSRLRETGDTLLSRDLVIFIVSVSVQMPVAAFWRYHQKVLPAEIEYVLVVSNDRGAYMIVYEVSVRLTYSSYIGVSYSTRSGNP
jgi:hypothetical protein